MDKLEFLHKIKALAERGVDGERANAQKLLDKMMAKYGYTYDDITDEQRQWYKFKVTGNRKWLFFAIVSNVTEPDKAIRYRNKGSVYEVEMTKSESMIVTSMYDFYRKAMLEEIKILRKAFVIKHKLWSSKASDSARNMSREEYEKLLKAFKMSGDLQDLSYNKQLNKG